MRHLSLRFTRGLLMGRTAARPIQEPGRRRRAAVSSNTRWRRKASFIILEDLREGSRRVCQTTSWRASRRCQGPRAASCRATQTAGIQVSSATSQTLSGAQLPLAGPGARDDGGWEPSGWPVVMQRGALRSRPPSLWWTPTHPSRSCPAREARAPSCLHAFGSEAS